MQIFGEIPFPKIFQAPNKLQELNDNKISLFHSFFIMFNRLSVGYVSFSGFIKEISPRICILCVRVKINKHSCEHFCVSILF